MALLGHHFRLKYVKTYKSTMTKYSLVLLMNDVNEVP